MICPAVPHSMPPNSSALASLPFLLTVCPVSAQKVFGQKPGVVADGIADHITCILKKLAATLKSLIQFSSWIISLISLRHPLQVQVWSVRACFINLAQRNYRLSTHTLATIGSVHAYPLQAQTIILWFWPVQRALRSESVIQLGSSQISIAACHQIGLNRGILFKPRDLKGLKSMVQSSWLRLIREWVPLTPNSGGHCTCRLPFNSV